MSRGFASHTHLAAGGGGGGGTFSSPATGNQGQSSAVTAGDGSPTGLTLSATPRGLVRVNVNAGTHDVGNGVKTKDCYFSTDGGTTAKAFGTFAAGDEMIWNGAIAGFDLDGSDDVDFAYDVVT